MEFSKPLRRKKEQRKESKILQENQEQSSSEEVSEDELLTPVTDGYSIDIVENLRLLTIAKNEGDLIQQVYLSSKISDFYRARADRIKNSSVHIVEKIEYLKQAIAFLERAVATMQQIKVGIEGNDEISKLKYWTTNLLQETQILLSKSLKHQRVIEEKFEKSRLSARTHIINKYGREGWYKDDEFDIESKSLAAQTLWVTKKRVAALEGLQTNIARAFQLLKEAGNHTSVINQIELTSTSNNPDRFFNKNTEKSRAYDIKTNKITSNVPNF